MTPLRNGAMHCRSARLIGKMGSWKKRLAYHINNKYYNGDELMLQESWTTIIILVTALAYLIYKLKK